LAKLVTRDIDYGETSTFFRQPLKICFDEDLDRFLGRINFNPYWRIPKINLVSATIPSSDDGAFPSVAVRIPLSTPKTLQILRHSLG
jgi:hypothetical protein